VSWHRADRDAQTASATKNPSGISSAASRRKRERTSWSIGQRAAPPGGSLTTSLPPTRRKGRDAASTATGPPNALAVTATNDPTRSARRAATSARAQTTSTRSAMPRRCTIRANWSVRRDRASSSVTCSDGRRTATISPGTPAPLPRSNTRPAWGSAAKNRSLWATASAGDVPSTPSRCWSARASTRSSNSSRIRRADDDPTIGLFALGAGHHTADGSCHVMDDLPVCRTHRLE